MPTIRNISDTALWAARYRAVESERPDALFHDPFARRLAGERGEQIASSMPSKDKQAWAWMARTYLFDQLIEERVADGVDVVVNLAAGLDVRPYRMALPSSLRWIEVDLPGILDYKEEILGGEKPVCVLERIRLDLADIDARRDLFGRAGGEARKALILAEGLMIYLTEETAGALARDLAAPPGFRYWILELASPGLLRIVRRIRRTARRERHFDAVRAQGGTRVFEPFGWKPIQVQSFLRTAARLKRLSLGMRILSMLPESSGAQGSRPWSAACLFEKR